MRRSTILPLNHEPPSDAAADVADAFAALPRDEDVRGVDKWLAQQAEKRRRRREQAFTAVVVVSMVLAGFYISFRRSREYKAKLVSTPPTPIEYDFGWLDKVERTRGGRYYNASTTTNARIPCIVYVTAPRWTDALAALWDRNLRTSPCKLKFHNDDALLASAAASGVGDAVNSIAPWAYKSDLWRYAAIYKTGGIYFDAEMELLMPIDHIFDLSRGGLQVVADRCVVKPCTETSRCVYNAAFASAAHDPTLGAVLDHALDNVEARSYGHNDSATEPWLGITGPCAMAAAVAGRDATIVATYNGTLVSCDDSFRTCPLIGMARCQRKLQPCMRNVDDVKGELGSAHYGGTWVDRQVYYEPGAAKE